MTQHAKKDPIPEHATREELAKFWDTHSFADYWDDLKPARVTVDKDLRTSSLENTMSVRFDGHTMKTIRSLAAKKGIGPSTLIRMATKEYLSSQSV